MIQISGMGGICAAGSSVSQIEASFRAGKRSGGLLTLFSSDLDYPVFQVQRIPNAWDRSGRRTVGLALSAVAEALEDACLPRDLSSFRVGVCLGTTVASHLNELAFYRQYRAGNDPSLKAVDRYLEGNLAEAVGHEFSCHGPKTCVVNACSSGADAIGVALAWLQRGICDIAIAGGAEELNRVPYCGFASLGILSPSLCTPYDKNRSGLNLGEGAGVLVLENTDVVRRERPESDLLLSGYGCAGDAFHLTAPRPDGSGLEKALALALEQAGAAPEDVAFINAHGTATRDNDAVEGNTLARVFGSDMPLTCTKGYTGHTLGAAGGLEAVFAAHSLRHGWIPKSIGFENPDDEIAINPVRETTSVRGAFAVSTSLAFGGTNSVVVIGKTDQTSGRRRTP